MTHQEHMQAIERSACRSYQATGHNLQGPVSASRSTTRQIKAGHLAQIACLAIVIGIVIVVGVILGAI